LLVAEGVVILKASCSSVAATIVDGVLYQFVLFLTLNYTVAAFSGAVVGGVANFVLNRRWAFPPTKRSLRRQALMYAAASAVVYLGLQGSLMVFVEVLHVNAHLAWFPATVLAWVVLSYPLFRFVVFAKPRRSPVL